MEMPCNNFLIIFMHNILKHGAKAFIYFHYDKHNFLLDWIKAFSNTKQNDNAVSLKRVLAEEKAMEEAQKSSS